MRERPPATDRAANPAPDDAAARLADRLTLLGRALRDAPLVLDVADAATGRVIRDELADQISDYLLPRLARLDAPVLAVVGGSTGAGKSSLTNALVGVEVTTPGVLRPTTRRPVLACNPADQAWFADRDGRGAVLPSLPRTTGPADQAAAGDGLHLITAAAVPQGVGILDSPDIDSVETANHDLAALLLGAADLWLFVTTAVRYADAVPWAYLRRAAERSVALAVVVNRVPPGAQREIVDDLATRLASEGLGDAALFAIDEGDLDRGAAAIGDWLDDLAGSATERRAVIGQTIDGLVASIPSRVDDVADAVEHQARARAALADAATHRWSDARVAVDRGIDDGVRLRDEVLQRFGEHVGTSELMGRLQTGIGRLRDRVGATLRGRATPAVEVRREVGDTLEDLIVRVADRTALAVADAWTATPGGRVILDTAPGDLTRADPQLRLHAGRAVDRWQEAVLARIVDTAGSRVSLARSLSLGINGVAAALMLGVFSQTGGLTGGEAAIAGGAAAASQTVLSAVFGDQVVRDLVRWARRDLLDRAETLFATEVARYERVVGVLPDGDVAEHLRTLAADLS